MSLLVVGSVAFDTVETHAGRREGVLGGSATFFSTAASFFTPVRLVAVVGEDFPERHVEELEARGVDTAGLQRQPGQTFRWEGRYDDLNEATTLDTQLNVFEQFQPELPAGFERSDYVFLANIDPVLQGQVLDQIRAPRLVALDTMNFWIEDIIPGKRAALEAVVARVDLLFINDKEAELLSGEDNVVKAAQKIKEMGPSTVVIKRGEFGALMFSEDGIFAVPAMPLERVVDPTGAGDSFAGGFMGFLAASGRVDAEGIRRAAVAGSVTASFAVEDFSLDRLKALDKGQIAERYQAFRDLVRIPE
ncbi:MAG: PfkB family carbohydrate kinase [Myxococcota bacterium]|nr:PfkB family carbohydrate kinase [Myxococcota bacterium]